MHYASLYKLPSVYDVVDAYQNDPNSDFHQTVADMAEIPRTQAKTINLGLFYGMGKAKLQAELGVSKDKAAELFNTYHAKVPFVKQLMDKASNRAQDRGQIRTLLGRLCRFPSHDLTCSFYSRSMFSQRIFMCHCFVHTKTVWFP